DMKGRKGSTDEGGVRVPFLVRWLGKIKAGITIPEIAGAIDLLPTLTAMAGVARVGNKPLDGRDFSPLLLGNKSAARIWPERMIFTHQSGQVSVRTQQYRLDSSDGLFDMVADPGQRTNVAIQKPEIATRLSEAVAAWRKEMFGSTAASAGGQKGKARSRSDPNAPDSRPYPVGYAVFPRTPLPARDGVPHGGIRRSAPAPNCSYFVNWTSREDSMTWDIEVATTGGYEVEVQYTCPEQDAGSTIELEFKGSELTGKVAKGWDPPLYTDQDRVLRRAESLMKEFRTLNLGVMRLEKGRGLLTLRALEIPGKSVMDMRMVVLTLKKP
ncbi:MAG: N-acetylgalactosamine 6-sulfate sulfatase, partial [Verrucomicrobia bacterium]